VLWLAATAALGLSLGPLDDLLDAATTTIVGGH
jgi:hypothetical protein